MHEEMKEAALKLGFKIGKKPNFSLLVREMVVKYLDQMVKNSLDSDDSKIKVVLEIPAEIRSDAVKLKEWLQVKTDAIARALS